MQFTETYTRFRLVLGVAGYWARLYAEAAARWALEEEPEW